MKPTPTKIQYTSLPERWPGRPITSKKNNPFRVVTWSQTDKVLQKELRAVGAKDVELALDIRNPGYFKQDGGLRADARPATPAVVLSFTDRKGVRLTFPCATYGDWVVNVYAIARSLENLRAVDRYGVTQGDAQYVGFKSLPAPAEQGMTLHQAAEIIGEESGMIEQAVRQYESVFVASLKLARRRAHPDSGTGGTAERFARVEEAAQVLMKHFAKAPTVSLNG